MLAWGRKMEIVTVGRRFQVVIPKSIRKRMRLRPGDKMLVELVEGKVVFSPLKPRRDNPLGVRTALDARD